MTAGGKASVSSRRPYLLRAMHEWMTDNDQTPHLIVDACRQGVQVPNEYVKDGKIVLNVSHAAIRDLHLGNDGIEFEARFGGRSMRISLPMQAVIGIYARETGEGMLFGGEEDGEPGPESGAPGPAGDASGGSRRGHLKVVK
jgi:stringent starvation protein B